MLVAATGPEAGKLTAGRLAAGYAVLGVLLVGAIAVSVSLGRDEHAQPAIAGVYSTSSACLGESVRLTQSGQEVLAARRHAFFDHLKTCTEKWCKGREGSQLEPEPSEATC